MKKITREELNTFLRKHKLWLVDNPEGERADLSGADLSGADLWGADLWGANLWGANLSEAKNVNYPIACPEKGSFIGFKKAGDYIIELEIPADALRCSATSRKCRCSKAKVLSFTTYEGETVDLPEIPSDYDKEFVYRLGETVEVKDFNTNRWNECSAGIHFFITRQEAVDY